MMNHTNDPFSEALADWRVNPPRDPSFRAGVWARVEAMRREPWAAYVRRHALTSGLALLAVVAVGGWVGMRQAHARADRDRALLVQVYLSEIDSRLVATDGTP